MKKSDRSPRPRIPRAATEKKDPWRDAPKEEILARGKGKTDRSAPAPRPKKAASEGGERKERREGPQRSEARGKKDFGGKPKDKRGDDLRGEKRGSFQKSDFKKERPRKADEPRDASAKPRKLAKGFGQEVKAERGEKKSFPSRDERRGGGEKPFGRKPRREDGERDSRPFTRSEKPFGKKLRRDDERDSRGQRDARPQRGLGEVRSSKPAEEKGAAPASGDGAMTLNKYLAHAGLSSRRDAATAIKEGKVQVNGETLLTPGYRVQPGDKVTFEGKPMKPQTKKVYVLLNKPKGFITTTDDEHDRRTVMELVQAVEADRLYPVGRLDRNTTGLLLLTNDGDLAQRLTHPKYEAKKIYQVGLDKPLTKGDFEKLLAGVELDDGIAKPDKLSFLETPSELGLEIHSGRNRIVRRMFEALGYEVEKLDRVMFAGLTKKNVPRGQWRHLTEEEVVRLKHFKS